MKGFTLIEFLIMAAIIILLGTFGVIAFSNYNKKYTLEYARTKIIAEINYARSQTLGSENRSSWGIRFESSRIIRFKGTAYNSGDPSNAEVLLPRDTSINSINLGGSLDVVFDRLTGRTSNNGTITLGLISNPQASTTISIYASGIAE